MGDENRAEKIENVGHNFCHPLSLHCNHRRTLEFAILNLHQTFLGIYSAQYRICEQWEGGWKSETSAGCWKNVSRVDEKSCPDKSTDIKPLGIAAPPIWLGDLLCECAFSHLIGNFSRNNSWTLVFFHKNAYSARYLRKTVFWGFKPTLKKKKISRRTLWDF